MSSLVKGLIYLAILCVSYFLHNYSKTSYQIGENFAERLRKETVVIKTNSDLNSLPNDIPVYISVPVMSNYDINDPLLNLRFSNTLAVKRKVTMYQTEKYIQNNRTHIKYIWSETHIPGNENPYFPFESEVLYPDYIYVGPFRFEYSFIKSHFSFKQFDRHYLHRDEGHNIRVPWETTNYVADRNRPEIMDYYNSLWAMKKFTIQDGDIYVFENNREDSVGDLRVTYYKNPSNHITIMGAKSGNTISPSFSDGNTFFFGEDGKIQMNEIINSMMNSNYYWYMGSQIFIVIVLIGSSLFIWLI